MKDLSTVESSAHSGLAPGLSLRTLWVQVRALTMANLKCRYRKTFAGFLWVVLNPLITYGVQGLVFSQFLKIDVNHYLLFLLSGLLPWIFMAQTIEMSSSIFVMSGQLIKSFTASPLVYLKAQVLDNIINFISGFTLALLPLWAVYEGLEWRILLLPLPLLLMSIGVFSLSWLLATAHVFFRDTKFLVSFAVNIGFFLTPVFYPYEFIPRNWRWLAELNPLYQLIRPFQVLVYDFSWQFFLQAMVYSSFTVALLLGAATWFWHKKRNMIYFYV